MAGILIADDNAAIRALLRNLVERQTPFRVSGEAANGQEAIERAQELIPDLILLDLVMPVVNGLDAASSLKAALPATKIILFTFHGDSIATLTANRGIDLVLSKPEGLIRIPEHINALLRTAAEPADQSASHLAAPPSTVN